MTTTIPLTDRQARFVQEYVVSLDRADAYARAGYMARGNAAEVNAGRLMRKPHVKAAIDAALAARAERTQVRQDQVLQELARIAFSSIDDYIFDDEGNVTVAPAAEPEVMRAVASLRKKVRHQGEQVTYDTDLRLWNKPEALRLVGQHLGMWEKKPTLEAFLACLPPDLAAQIRQTLGQMLAESAGLAPQEV
jgi:phage terminase small subunit